MTGETKMAHMSLDFETECEFFEPMLVTVMLLCLMCLQMPRNFDQH